MPLAMLIGQERSMARYGRGQCVLCCAPSAAAVGVVAARQAAAVLVPAARHSCRWRLLQHGTRLQLTAHRYSWLRCIAWLGS